MKDCTRLDVVTANLKKNKVLTEQSIETDHLWNLRKKSMQSPEWVVTDNSLKATEENNQCGLDVSIVYEKKLQRFINKIEFTHTNSGEKQPDKLSEKIILDLNNLASAASKLAKKLSNSNDLVDNTQSEIPSQISDE
jgi:hypothetical protein